MGARVLEKHFTLDKTLEGPDHRASLSPEELVEFVKMVRRVEQYMGSTQKIPNLSETQTRRSLQKCLIAKRNIKVGEVFTSENVGAKRTGGEGIPPIYATELYNRTSDQEYAVNEIIRVPK